MIMPDMTIGSNVLRLISDSVITNRLTYQMQSKTYNAAMQNNRNITEPFIINLFL